MKVYIVNTTRSHSSASSRTPFWRYFFLHFLFFISVRLKDLPHRSRLDDLPSISLPSCWPWSFLVLGKGSCMGTGDNCRHYDCCLVLSHFHTSQQQAVPTCPWMIFSRNDECFWGTLMSPAVSLLLRLWPLNCYPPPFSVYYFSHNPSACSRVGFFSLFVFPSSGFRERHFNQAWICPQEKEPRGAPAANLC